MMVKTKKRLLAICLLSSMITLVPQTQSKAAIPLPTYDIKRIMSDVQIMMQTAMEIKMEIESNYRIIQEIQHGGYASAAGMLFTKIQNGDYDRFGNNLKTMKSAATDASREVQYGAKEKKEEKALREKYLAQGMSEEEAKARARQEARYNEDGTLKKDTWRAETAQHDKEKQQAKEKDKAENRRVKELMKQGMSEAEARAQAAAEYSGKSAAQIALENQEARNKNAFNQSYNWLKENRAATTGALGAYNAIDNHDWGGALASAGYGVGGAFATAGNSQVGSAISGASYNAGAAWNAGMNHDWSQVVAAGGNAAGSVITGTGQAGLGMGVGGLANIAGGVMDVAHDSHSLGEAISQTAISSTYGQIGAGMGQVGAGYSMMEQQYEQQLAQEIAKRQAQEEANKKLEEQIKKLQEELKKSEREKCLQENEALQKAGKPGKVCL